MLKTCVLNFCCSFSRFRHSEIFHAFKDLHINFYEFCTIFYLIVFLRQSILVYFGSVASFGPRRVYIFVFKIHYCSNLAHFINWLAWIIIDSGLRSIYFIFQLIFLFFFLFKKKKNLRHYVTKLSKYSLSRLFVNRYYATCV
jgi:hypothetical protein